jgi:hypothetical protein
VEPTRESIAQGLRANESEIDEAIFRETRASVPDPVGDDPDYESGLYAAVAEAVDHCISVIEAGEAGAGLVPLPAATIGQARRAARRGVGIETVIHRVALGERMVKAFATTEADDLPARDLNRVLGSLGPAIDRLLHALTEEHRRERELREGRPDARRDEVIEQLLAGERPGPADEAILGYALGGWHLGLVGAGRDVEDSLRHLAETLGCWLLLFHSDTATTSGWLGGGRRRLDLSVVRRQPALSRGADVAFAVGEPGEGITGWRHTHKQARLALLTGRRRSRRLICAADVLPEAILSRDRASARLLVATYLAPLEKLRRNGELARETLWAFFEHDRKVSATTEALDIARGTVEHRLREVEGAIGKPLDHEHLTHLELALKLEAELAHGDGP